MAELVDPKKKNSGGNASTNFRDVIGGNGSVITVHRGEHPGGNASRPVEKIVEQHEESGSKKKKGRRTWMDDEGDIHSEG